MHGTRIGPPVWNPPRASGNRTDDTASSRLVEPNHSCCFSSSETLQQNPSPDRAGESKLVRSLPSPAAAPTPSVPPPAETGLSASSTAAAMEISSAEEEQRGEGFRDHQNVEEEIYRRLLDSFAFITYMENPEWWHTNIFGRKSKEQPPPPPPRWDLFQIKLSAKRSQASWSHKEASRFCPQQAGAGPIRVARLVEDAHGPRLENAGDGGRLGIIAFKASFEDSLLGREVAFIRRFRHGTVAGLALTSNVSQLGVRLHDKLFLLPSPSSAVTFTFTERWFYIPSKWTEERLYAGAAGLDYIDITSTLEKLLRTLYQMYEQEEQEKKIACEVEEQERRRREELELKPLAYIPLGWGTDADARWESPDQAMHRRHELLLELDADGPQVRCHCVEQEGPRDMRRRLASDGSRFVLPLTTTAASFDEAVGFVEGYLFPEPETTVDVKTEQCGKKTEKLRRPVAMVSVVHAESKGVQVHALTFKFLSDWTSIRLDDGVVLTGWNGISVDIHWDNDDHDDVPWWLSSIQTESWSNQILEWKADDDDDSPIPCACLLVQLSRKLSKLVNTESVPGSEENGLLRLEAMFAVESEAEENDHQEQGHKEDNNKGEYSLLFPSPGGSDWLKVSDPYVPKFPTEEEIRRRKEMRKEQLKKVMEPIRRPVSELGLGWHYSLDEPYLRITVDARPPVCGFLCNQWPLSDKSESTLRCKSNLYPRLACLEWCNCSPYAMLQLYTIELIIEADADSLIHPCKLDISGFVAVRDFRDGLRNYVFNRGTSDPFTAVPDNGVVLLPLMSPRRAIMSFLLLEFDLKMKRTGDDDGIDSYQQLIQGVSEHPGAGRRFLRVNELSIRSGGADQPIPMMRVKLAMIVDGVEATVELRPLALPWDGIRLRCAARTARIADDIVLFDGRYSGDENTAPLQFVIATELSGGMDIYLEAEEIHGERRRERWCVGFESKFHAFFSEAVDFSFARVLLSVAWSKASGFYTYGPPDL